MPLTFTVRPITSAEPTSPETVAEHYFMRIAAVCAECSTHDRTAAQQPEEVAVHPGVLDPFGFAIGGIRPVGLPVHREVLEGSTAAFPIIEVRYASVHASTIKSIGHPEQSNAPRLSVW